MEFNEEILLYGWITLHLSGLLVAWATRIAVGTWASLASQLAFYTLLACLSCAAWYSHQLELGLWIPTGLTIGAMLMLAVADLRPAANSQIEVGSASSSGLY